MSTPELHLVVVHRGADHGNFKTAEPVTILIQKPFPECKTLDEASALATADAEALVKALSQSLPQGTLHKVIWMLMRNYACHFIGRID
jgi:hypothetical protein